MDEDEKEGGEEVCVCVTLGVIGILLDLFSIIAGGASSPSSLAPTKTLDVCW